MLGENGQSFILGYYKIIKLIDMGYHHIAIKLRKANTPKRVNCTFSPGDINFLVLGWICLLKLMSMGYSRDMCKNRYIWLSLCNYEVLLFHHAWSLTSYCPLVSCHNSTKIRYFSRIKS